MILALDVGNTNIVIGCIDQTGVHFRGRISTDKDKTEMEYAVLFKTIFEINNIDTSAFEGVIISSVVPPLKPVLSDALVTVTGLYPVTVDIKKNHGLKIKMDNPMQMGSDLLVDSVAALAEYPAPVIIFDMGTATTVSVLDKEGSYIASIILPGVQISQEALSGRTSQLPKISYEAPQDGILAKNTIDSMKSGLVYGTASMIDGIVERIEDELKEKATVIATGGLAKCVTEHCNCNVIYDDDLLLKGLWILWNKYKQKNL